MEKRAKQLEYLITSMILLGIGMLFFFMNESVNTYTVLRFGLFQIMQSVLLLICAILLWYRAYVVRREQETAEGGAETLGAAPAAPEEAGEEKREAKRDAVDSVNATMLLVVVTVLVVGFYLFTLKPREDVTGAVAPLHMVVCVVSFILYACVERWWSMQLDTNPDAASICNLMVLNKIAVAALMADMVTSFTELFSVSQYVDYVILGCWFYVAAMAAVSVAVKMTRHREELVFRLYILFPVYYYGGQKGSGALTWLEQHTGISMRSLWSLKFIKMILPSCAMAVLLLVWLSTCVVQVETYQQGALYRFGSLAREDILEPGLHFKLPVPFEEVKIYNVTQPQGMIVGYEGDVNNKNNLWTRPHEGEEQALLLGNGNELVAINLKITYRISDLYTYLTRYSSPEDVLNAKGYEVVMGETIHTDINTIISEDRSQLSHRIEEQLKEYAREAELGLDRPFAVRYLEWLAGFFTGDLGISYSYSQPVWELIAPKVGVTLCLSALSFLLIVVVSIPLGVRGAGREGGRLDAAATAFNQLCMAVPPFFTGILISWLFSITLRWFVHGQFPDLGADPTGAFRYLFFAAAAIAIPRIAMTVRMLRSTIQGEMRRDYVRTAISRGNDRGAVLRRHVLRNALVPVVTFLAQTMAEIVAAGIVVEQVFAIPGLGRLLVASISNRDYPVVQAIVVILAFWVVLAGTVADIVNQRIDPRLRLGGAS